MGMNGANAAVTAVVMACVCTVPGAGAAQMALEIGGRLDFLVGIFDNDVPNQENQAFLTDVELRIRTSAHTDSGLLYGSQLQLKIVDETNSAVWADEAYIFLAAGWGRIELGKEDGAMPTMAIYAPTIGFGQLDGDYDRFTTESIQDLAPPFYALASEKATKATYYTPRYLGFQAGISYAPDADNDDDASFQPSMVSKFLEGGVNYLTEVRDVGIALGATLSRSRDRSASATKDNPVGYQVGTQLSYAGLVFGGGYTDYDGAQGVENGFNVGLTYTSGEGWALGGQYARMSTRGNRVQQALGVGASYAPAPGLLVGADYIRYRSELPDRKVQGDVMVLGTRFSF